VEDLTVDFLFLVGTVEAFGRVVGLGHGAEGELYRDAPEPYLVEEVIGGVLGAVVHAQCQPPAGVAPVLPGDVFKLMAMDSRAVKRLLIMTT